MTRFADAQAHAHRLKLMAFDVDGVLTDGSLFYSDDGIELKAFNTLDGLGLKMLQNAGLQVAIITGRKAGCVEARMKNLGIDLLFQGVGDKLAVMQRLLGDLGLQAAEAGYMGDDLPDLQIMAGCGFSATPANGHALAKRIARHTTQLAGGHGAVREICEFILDAQGKLDAAYAPFLPGDRGVER
ncbi:KdsC family phosphatase [Propionivibrio limicola]|uniref:KdsC family phosphatase n=1 Tax=Propionivibrio limicola TaxID=167645 RepID=UPI0012922DE5|nr:phenylphosphate carboxylase subunit delta [Propionivibrio limicola]